MTSAIIAMVWAGALTGLGSSPDSASTHSANVAMGHAKTIATVTTQQADGRPSFRLPTSPGSPAMTEKGRTIEWMHEGSLRMTAAYASTRPTQTLGRLDVAMGSRATDVRSAKGLRLAADLLSGDGARPGGSLAFDMRLQHVRIQDTSLTNGGEKLGDARLALMFTHTW